MQSQTVSREPALLKGYSEQEVVWYFKLLAKFFGLFVCLNNFAIRG